MREDDEERLELKLLTDPAFGEQFDSIVDEITDQYIGNELKSEERKRVEQYFLKAPERQKKVEFACELLRYAAVERAEIAEAPVEIVASSDPSWWDRARLFWNTQTLALRFATMTATIVIVIGVGLLALSSRNAGSPVYSSIALNISAPDRSAGAAGKSVKLPSGAAGVRVELILPDGAPQATSYRVNLTGEQGTRAVPVTEQSARSVVVVIPATEVPRGSYVISLTGVNADKSEQRIRGSYILNVE